MDGLFNVNSILLHMLNSAILCAALYFLLYKPVRKFMLAREEAVKQQLQRAADAEGAAKDAAGAGEEALRQAKLEAAKRVQDSAQAAQEQAAMIVGQAEDKARDVVSQAQAQARQMLDAAQAQIQDQATELAVAISAKLIGKDLSQGDQSGWIQGMLEKLQ